MPVRGKTSRDPLENEPAEIEAVYALATLNYIDTFSPSEWLAWTITLRKISQECQVDFGLPIKLPARWQGLPREHSASMMVLHRSRNRTLWPFETQVRREILSRELWVWVMVWSSLALGRLLDQKVCFPLLMCGGELLVAGRPTDLTGISRTHWACSRCLC